jgi:hypothetical protein
MTITITLSNSGGVLDTRAIETGEDDSAEISSAIWDAIDDWMLAPGDTIKITSTDDDYSYEAEAAHERRQLGSYGR